LTTTRRKNLLADARGAIYVELLLVVPVVALLYASTLYVHRLGLSEVAVHRHPRQSVWAQVVPGCVGGGAADGRVQLQGPTPVADGELDQVAGRGLQTVVQPIRTLPPLFNTPAATELVGTSDETVTRPSLLNGTAQTRGSDRMPCNDSPKTPQLAQVMKLTCEGLLGAGGDCQ